MKLLFVGLLAASLFSCGNLSEKFGRSKSATTNVHFALPSEGASTQAALNGGIMIYALDEDENGAHRNFPFTNEDLANGSGASVSIPNGSYRFAAIGFDTAGMMGTARCGSTAGPIVLAGKDVEVAITVSANSCMSKDFSLDPSTMDGHLFKQVKLISCSPSTNFATIGPSSNCSSTPGNFKTNMSYNYELVGYEKARGAAPAYKPGILSACLTADASLSDQAAFSVSGKGFPMHIYSTGDGNAYYAFSLGYTLQRIGSGDPTTITNISGTPSHIFGSGSTIFVSTSTGLYKSLDSGSIFSQATTGNMGRGSIGSGKVLVADKANVGKVWLGNADGTSFTNLTFATGVSAIATYISGPGRYYVLTDTGKLYGSTDGSAITWSQVFDFTTVGASGARSISSAMGQVFVGASNGPYVPTNSDFTAWGVGCVNGTCGTYSNQANVISDITTDGSNLYAGTYGGIIYSSDFGAHWATYSTTLNAVAITSVAPVNGVLQYTTSSTTDGVHTLVSSAGQPMPASNTSPRVPIGGFFGPKSLLPFAVAINRFSDGNCANKTGSITFQQQLGIEPPAGFPGLTRISTGAFTPVFVKDF